LRRASERDKSFNTRVEVWRYLSRLSCRISARAFDARVGGAALEQAQGNGVGHRRFSDERYLHVEKTSVLSQKSKKSARGEEIEA